MLWEATRGRLLPFLERVGSGRLRELRYAGGAPPESPGDEEAAISEAVARLAARDVEALRRDARRFAEVYSPVGILPPDQYMAQVVQLTQGCSFNTCTFCTFYRDIPFHIRTPDELQRHLTEVDAFLGRGTLLRRSLFLGDANALVTPMERLEPLVAGVRDHYRGAWGRLDGMHAFLDGFSGARKRPDDYRRLRALGLKQVHVGLESGHDPLLKWLRKPGRAKDAADAISAMKEAGLHVGVIVLLGVGGAVFDEGHVRDTGALLAGLRLEATDIVYFSEFVDRPGAPYGVIAREEGIEPYGAPEMARQRGAIAGALPSRASGGPRTAVYDIREFTY